MTHPTRVPSNVALTLNPFREAMRVSDFWNEFGRVPKVLADRAEARFVPHIDVSESDEEYRVTAELPGLEPGDFEIVAEDDVLTLKGEKKRREASKSGGYRRTETRVGSFVRRLRFPEPLSEEGLKATYENGVLTVVLPKPEEAKPQVRSIPVESA